MSINTELLECLGRIIYNYMYLIYLYLSEQGEIGRKEKREEGGKRGGEKERKRGDGERERERERERVGEKETLTAPSLRMPLYS